MKLLAVIALIALAGCVHLDPRDPALPDFKPIGTLPTPPNHAP